MGISRTVARSPSPRPKWDRVLAAYQRPDRRVALRQLGVALGAYLALWALMIFWMRAGYPYLPVLLGTVVAAGFLVRLFILFHDACHGSFFRATWANALVGYLCGTLVFVSYPRWRASHLTHHTTVADLDRRGTGDVWTMTVAEYRAAPWYTRAAYRLFRHPLVMLGLGPLGSFVLAERVPPRGRPATERRGVWLTNLLVALILLIAWRTIGLGTYLAIQGPIILMAGSFGIWLFYVQHQFPGVYWARHAEWDAVRSALEGSSHYHLPKLLNWFSGDIGLHHIHHMRPRIPNYLLRRCYDEIPELQAVKPLTVRTSLACLSLNLYDEERGELVSFRALRGR
ncbi:MAG: fatty acid desaturase [Anaerolineae bacterium]